MLGLVPDAEDDGEVTVEQALAMRDDQARRAEQYADRVEQARMSGRLGSVDCLRPFDPDPIWDAARDPVNEQRQVGVVVEGGLVVSKALDAVNRPAGRAGGGEVRDIQERHPLRAQNPCRGWRFEI